MAWKSLIGLPPCSATSRACFDLRPQSYDWVVRVPCFGHAVLVVDEILVSDISIVFLEMVKNLKHGGTSEASGGVVQFLEELFWSGQ